MVLMIMIRASSATSQYPPRDRYWRTSHPRLPNASFGGSRTSTTDTVRRGVAWRGVIDRVPLENILISHTSYTHPGVAARTDYRLPNNPIQRARKCRDARAPLERVVNQGTSCSPISNFLCAGYMTASRTNHSFLGHEGSSRTFDFQNKRQST